MCHDYTMIEAECPALLIVDVQNDFCPGGALAVADGDQVVPVLNRLAARAAALGLPVYASRDWHPIDSIHFAANGGPWPAHCVAGTPGARLHPDLALPSRAMIVTKGTTRDDHGYSAFEGQVTGRGALADDLRRARRRSPHRRRPCHRLLCARQRARRAAPGFWRHGG